MEPWLNDVPLYKYKYMFVFDVLYVLCEIKFHNNYEQRVKQKFFKRPNSFDLNIFNMFPFKPADVAVD